MTGIGIGIGMHDNVMAADGAEAAADEYKRFLECPADDLSVREVPMSTNRQNRRKHRRGFAGAIPPELAPRRGEPCDGRCRPED